MPGPAMGVWKTLPLWIGRTLENKQIEVPTDTNTIVMTTTQSCPQNRELSPLMWSTIVDEFLGGLTDTNIQVQYYASAEVQSADNN